LTVVRWRLAVSRFLIEDTSAHLRAVITPRIFFDRKVCTGFVTPFSKIINTDTDGGLKATPANQKNRETFFMAYIDYKSFTLGVEEEYMVMDPASRELKSHEQRSYRKVKKL
jgi:hypothetical protein